MKKFKIRRVYVGIIIGALIIATLLIANESVFSVQKIILTSTNPIDGKKLDTVRGIKPLYHKNILFLSDSNIQKNILEANPNVKRVTVLKQYPNSLNIVVVFLNPSAYLQVNDGYFMVAEDGRILEKTKTKSNANLPLIQYYQKLDYYAFQSGDTITYKDITTSLQLLTKLLDLGFIINNIDINGLSMIVLNSNDKRFVFTTEKDVSEQEYQLVTIVRKLRTDKKEFKSLDLRFDKPVISL